MTRLCTICEEEPAIVFDGIDCWCIGCLYDEQIDEAQELLQRELPAGEEE